MNCGEKLNVLLVEDDDDHADLLGIGLGRISQALFTMKRAKSLTSALSMLGEQHWDLIFLDLGLPESNGLETLRTLLEQNKTELPVIVLTSTENETIAAEAIKAGALDYVTKSFHDNRLLERSIHQSVERWKLRCAKETVRHDLKNFAHCAAHDLKAPLNNIDCFICLLEDELEPLALSDKACEYLDILKKCSLDSFRVVDDLLNFSTQESKEITKENTSLQALAEQAICLLRSSLEETNAQVVTQKLPTLPVDSDLIVHVLQNLISNAVKYRNGAAPHIVVDAQETDQEYRIRVSDNGVGIPERYLTQIFEPFKRLPSTRGEEGTGLGLSICKRFIEAHSGTIWAERNSDGGSTFVFTLPKA